MNFFLERSQKVEFGENDLEYGLIFDMAKDPIYLYIESFGGGKTWEARCFH